MVVVMLGVVAALTIPRFGEVKENAYIDAMKNDLQNLSKVQENYYHDNSHTYAHPDSLRQIEEFTYTEDVSTDSVALGDDWWYTRVRHNKTDVKCNLWFEEQSEVSDSLIAQRIVCDDGFASNNNQAPTADFEVRTAGSSPDVTVSGDMGPEADSSFPLLSSSVSSDGVSFDGGFEPDVELIFDASLSHDPDGDDLTYDWSFQGEKGIEVEKTTGSGVEVNNTYFTTGSFGVTLIVDDGHNHEVSSVGDTTKTIIINQKPTADFTSSPNPSIVDEEVCFTNNSDDPDNDPLSYDWNFGGLGTSSSFEPCFTFDQTGDFPVTLTVEDSNGASDQASLTQTVEEPPNQPPTVNFDYTPAYPDTGEVVQFTEQASDPDGTIESYFWSFANAGTSTEPNPTASWDSNGLKEVCLTATDNEGASTTECEHIRVGPVCHFTWSPADPEPDEAVSFSEQTDDPNDAFDNFAWDFDGDGTDDSTDPNPTHTYPDEGSFDVRLEVTDDSNNSMVCTRDLVVNDDTHNSPPNADFTFNPTHPDTAEMIQFTDQSNDPDGEIVSREWDFTNNGTFDTTGTNPVHSYPTSGNYPVTLKVEDNDGATDQITRTVPVGTQGPTANFTYSPDEPLTLDTVHFDASSSSPGSHPIADYDWAWDDGSDAGVGVTAQHVYGDDGNYSVTLTVTDTAGLTGQATKTVPVENRPPTGQLVINFPGETADVGEAISYLADNVNDPDGTVASWHLDYGDDSDADGTDTGSLPDHVYDASGEYDVCLTLTDNDGDTSLSCTPFSVGTGGPTADFSWSPLNPATGETTTFWNASTAPEPLTDVSWEFPDGSVASGDTVQHTFDSEGSHDVKLTVTDENGETAQKTQAVEVITTGEPTVTLDPNPVVINHQLTAKVDSSWTSDPGSWDYEWNWGDNSTSTGQQATHTYSSLGDHTIVLTATHQSTGYQKSTSKDVTVDPALNASFDWTPASPTPEDTIAFDGSFSSGNIDRYDWAFDGSFQGSGVTHESTLPSGDTDVRLIIHHSSSITDTSMQVVAVSSSTQADIALNPNPVGDDNSVTLDGSGSSGSNLSYSWYWKHDGESFYTGFASGQTWSGKAGALFHGTGDKPIRLVIENLNTGVKDTAFDTLTVEKSTQADIALNPNPVGDDNSVTLDGSGSSGSNLSYSWYWKHDGKSFYTGFASGQTWSGKAGALFHGTGDKPIRLVIENNDTGVQDTAFDTLTVEKSTQADIALNPNPVGDDDSVTLDGSGSSGSSLIYTWSYQHDGDSFYNVFASGETWSGKAGALFNGTGDKPIRLVIENLNTGVKDTAFATLTVEKSTQADIALNPNPVAAADSVTLDGSGSSGSSLIYTWSYQQDGDSFYNAFASGETWSGNAGDQFGTGDTPIRLVIENNDTGVQDTAEAILTVE